MNDDTKPAINPPVDQIPLRLEDHRLQRSYTVIEIATLAAACRGNSPKEQLEEAIELLAGVEYSALTPIEKKLKNEFSQLFNTNGEISKVDAEHIESLTARELRIRDLSEISTSLIRACERDTETGKIKRASLALEICKKSGTTESPEHSQRLFKKWASIHWNEESEIKYRCTGEDPSFEDHQAAYESGKKEKLIHDDDAARYVIAGFLEWLESRSRRKISKPLRSHKDGTAGQIVSPKTKGASRSGDGKYTPKN